MTINEIFEIVLEYASIWAPSLIAIIGIATTVVGAYAKLRLAIVETKKASEELKSNETIKELKSEFKALAIKNEELTETNKLLLDQITKIKGYADLKKRGK